MPASGGGTAGAVKAMVYEEHPKDGNGPFCGHFLLAAVPSIGDSINIKRNGRGYGGKIVEVCFFGIAEGEADQEPPSISVTFKH